ncbi:integrin alpha FG-GAP repeat-containing protein 2 [Apophysomyces sp. BC1021]|nr:integrin alpha FG-GAP repeat-containing protein 2 [Apophysomyces sp. BC1021]
MDKVYLLDKDMWVFDGQITSLSTTMHPDKPNEPILLVAQPGNTFTIIDREGNRFNRDFTPQYSPSTHYGKHKQRRHSMHFAQPEEPKPKMAEKKESEDEELATTPKANQGPLSNLRKATRTIRTLLQGSSVKASVPTGLETENLIVSKDDGGLNNIKDPAGNEIRRSNYVVQNWPIMNGDDIIGDEESGAVATEIVIGKRHHVTPDSNRKCSGTEVGMLSMDDSSSSNAVSPTFSRPPLFTSGLSDRTESKITSQSDTDTTLVTPTSIASDVFSLQSNDNSIDSSDESESTHQLRRDSVESGSVCGTEGSWSEGDEKEDLPENELFVACAWNGVTYLIDWSKQLEEDSEGSSPSTGSNIRFQLVKFAFEGRVCAFTAGLYAVSPGHNVPCLFYVDFEDQIFVYYDVRISPGPVDGFIDPIDDDIEEALERIVGIESGIEALTSLGTENSAQADGCAIDLGDGWKGIVDEDGIFDTGHGAPMSGVNPNQLALADFIHECLYGFEDMKERLEREAYMFEHGRFSDHLPPSVDIRRLSDLNITIEPPLERESSDSEATNHDLYTEYITHRCSSGSSHDLDDALHAWMSATIRDTSLKED